MNPLYCVGRASFSACRRAAGDSSPPRCSAQSALPKQSASSRVAESTDRETSTRIIVRPHLEWRLVGCRQKVILNLAEIICPVEVT
jgi:hypothetical protein